MADKPDAKGSIDSYLQGVDDAKTDNPGGNFDRAVDKVAYGRGVDRYYDTEFDRLFGKK